MSDLTAQNVVAKIAQVADAVSSQAGVGGMETAGALLSYLAAKPGRVEAFMAPDFDLITGFGDPCVWLRDGCLTWQAMNGKIVSPEWVRRQKLIDGMKPRRGRAHG